jgi:hypothetical protein
VNVNLRRITFILVNRTPLFEIEGIYITHKTHMTQTWCTANITHFSRSS